jgi:hypothetical protein
MSPAECSVDGCPKARVGRGLCSGHYSRLKITGDVRPDVPLGARQEFPEQVKPCAQCGQSVVRRCRRDRVICRDCSAYNSAIRRQNSSTRSKRAASIKARRRMDKKSLIPSPRRGEDYSEIEDHIVMSPGSITEIAYQLGRSYRSVSGRRAWLRNHKSDRGRRTPCLPGCLCGKHIAVKCGFTNCDRPTRAYGHVPLGYCNIHREQYRRTGLMWAIAGPGQWNANRHNMRAKRLCSITDCPKEHHAKGLCTLHYQRCRKALPNR